MLMTATISIIIPHIYHPQVSSIIIGVQNEREITKGKLKGNYEDEDNVWKNVENSCFSF